MNVTVFFSIISTATAAGNPASHSYGGQLAIIQPILLLATTLVLIALTLSATKRD